MKFFIILCICSCCSIFLWKNKNNNLLHPSLFFNLWTLFKIIPRLIEMNTTAYSEKEWFIFGFFSCLAIVFTNLGIEILKKLKVPLFYLNNEKNGKALFSFSIIVFTIGVLSKFYLIYSSGGIQFVLSNLNIRTQLLAGNGYLNNLEILITVGLAANFKYILLELKEKGHLSLDKKTIFIFMFLIGGSLLIIFGARSPLLETILILFFIYHFTYKKITIRKMLSPRILGVGILMLLFLVMLPLLRYSENKDFYKDPVKWAKESIINPNRSVFEEVSTVDRDIFTYNYFQNQKKWHGKIYYNLMLQVVPSSIYEKKPPMDDGRYLYNLMQGVDIEPNTPNKVLPYQTSIPFSNEGFLYANFGFIGIIFGSLLMGVIYMYAYKLLVKSNFSLLLIIIYFQIIYQFKFSTLHLMSTMITIAYIFIFYKLFYNRSIRKLN